MDFQNISDSTFKEAFADIPSLQSLIDLANSLPELYETIVYTSIHDSQKVSKLKNGIYCD